VKDDEEITSGDTIKDEFVNDHVDSAEEKKLNLLEAVNVAEGIERSEWSDNEVSGLVGNKGVKLEEFVDADDVDDDGVDAEIDDVSNINTFDVDAHDVADMTLMPMTLLILGCLHVL
nr:hypothetical protein [Tanacetum cinerariifolium]